MDVCKTISKNVSENISGEYNQKLTHHAKQSSVDALNTTSKRLTYF